MSFSCPYRLEKMSGRSSMRLHGFTLIEVLVSVVILSVGIVVVLHALNSSLSLLARTHDAILASMLIREKMAEIEGSMREDNKKEPVSERGEIWGAPYNGFKWDVAVSRADTSGSLPDGQAMVQVNVTAGRIGSERQYSAATYMVVSE